MNLILRHFLDAHPKYWDSLTVDDDGNDAITGDYIEDFLRWRASEEGHPDPDAVVAKAEAWAQEQDDIAAGDGWKHGYTPEGQ